jgi:putative ABC transport system permease protein
MAPEKFPRGRRQFQVLARLAPGVSLRDANLELETIARTIEQEFGQEFKEYSGWRMVAETWSRINTRLLRPAGLILSGAVGFVMLLVCANIAGLLLGRSMRRSQELSIRAALGASRRRIICQLLTESVLLSLAGGAAGLVLAYLGIRWIGSAVSAVPFPVPGQLGLNTRVLLFTAGLSIAVGLMFGLMPALRISRSHLRDMLKCEGRAATAGTGRVRLQSVLVGVEVALAVILLAGGGLLIRSLANLHAVDTGFEPRNVLTMRLTLPREKYGPEQIGAFYLALTDRIEAIPGVHSASAATQFPPVVFNRDQLQVEGRGVKTEGELPTCYATLVSERYFDTLGIRLVRGRAFTTRDRPESPMVAIVNDVVARRYFPGEDPIGKRIKVGPPNSQTPWAEIVGIAASTQNRGLDVPRQAEVFASVRQAEGWWNQLFLLIKTEDSPWGVLEAIRREVAALDPDQPIYAVQTVEDVFSASLAQRRVASTMLSFFALFALSLAAVGIFSVVSYKVSARTREIGLRIALGATIGQVRRQVVRQAMVPVAAGAAFGLPVAVVMGRLMEDLLFQVKGTDLVTLLSVVCVLSAVATAASYLPALRASGKDPVAALRYE